MNIPPIRRRMLAVLAILVPLAGIFVVSVFRTGPFAPVSVRIDTIERKALTPTLSGIGTVEARWRYRIGPTRTGRLAELSVDVGDRVAASQTLGAMDPIDLDDRLAAQSATALSLESSIKMAESRLHETQSLQTYARSQHRRHLDLVKTGGVSVEAAEAASQREEAATASVASATAAVQLARSELAAARANLEALERQKDELTLRAPVDGLVVDRLIEPGSTAMAGESVVEMIDPASLWIHLRLNQIDAAGLQADLPCRIELRSRPGVFFPGRILRVEPLADEITEEMLAKVVFDRQPRPLPPLGELTEVDVQLLAEPTTLVAPAAAIRNHQGRPGLWLVNEEAPRFVPVRTGRRSADGDIQILSGLEVVEPGHRIIVQSERPVTPRSQLRIVQSDFTPGQRSP